MKTNAKKERDQKSRAAKGKQAAETLAKDARRSRSKWNKPQRVRARELLEEASNDDGDGAGADGDGLATHVWSDGRMVPLPASVTWRN